MADEPAPRVVVIGGSLGGLLAGALFLRAGWDAHVFERTDGVLEGRGAGITILPGLIEGLRLAGVEASEEELGVLLPERIVLDGAGDVVVRRDFPQVMTSWRRLFEVLRAGFPNERYHAGATYEQFDQNGDAVMARFADGSEVECELLVAADGNRSTIRSQLLPDVHPHYSGYIAWRCLVDESALGRDTHAMLFDRYTVCLPPGQQAIGYPVPGPDHSVAPGRRQYNVVWYRPVPEGGLVPLLTDADGRHHANGISPARIRPEVRAEMHATARSVLAPQFAEAVERARLDFFQPIVDLECPKLVDGRVVCVGDAAFLARPHTAMGVPKAVGDLRALVEAVGDGRGDLASRLAVFEARRLEVDRRIVAQGRYLGDYMEAQLGPAAERERVERERDPERVIMETAAPINYDY